METVTVLLMLCLMLIVQEEFFNDKCVISLQLVFIKDIGISKGVVK